MSKISEEQLFQAISIALDIDPGLVNIDSSIDNIDECHSLSVIGNKLTSLDELSNVKPQI